MSITGYTGSDGHYAHFMLTNGDTASIGVTRKTNLLPASIKILEESTLISSARIWGIFIQQKEILTCAFQIIASGLFFFPSGRLLL